MITTATNLPAPHPFWLPLAHDLIERLRLHYAGRDHLISDAPKNATARAADKSLTELFEAIQDSNDRAEQHISEPWTPVPARQILMTIRLAAAFGSEEALHAAKRSGAMTFLTDIPVEDLNLVSEVIRHCLPTGGWALTSPGVSDGAVSKSAEVKFLRC